MGNMQFNLDKKFENVACKDASSAKEILKTMQKVEDKVSDFFYSLSNISFSNFSIKATQKTCTITFKRIYLKELEDLFHLQDKSSIGPNHLASTDELKLINKVFKF